MSSEEIKVDTPLKKAYNKKVKEATQLIIFCEEDCEKKYNICNLVENIIKYFVSPRRRKIQNIKKISKKN
jgi:hypothetical protein